MGFMKKKNLIEHANAPNGSEKDREETATTETEQKITILACLQGGVASLGGLIFGYIRYV